MDSNNDVFTVTCERFVDSVIHNLGIPCGADRCRHPCRRYTYLALTHRIQPFQDFDTGES